MFRFIVIFILLSTITDDTLLAMAIALLITLATGHREDDDDV